jgi:WD40 repeat protein
MPLIGGFAPTFSGDGRYMATTKIGAESVVWDRLSNQPHHTVRGSALGFSPDSRSLLVARSDEGAISLINSETGDEQWKAVLGSALQYGGLAFAPDGKTIALSWDNVVRFFEADSGRERFEANDAHRGAVSAVCYTPDAREIVTAGNDGTIRQWDASSGRMLRVMNDAGAVHRLAISPDGTRLASTALRAPANSPAFRIWDLTNGALKHEFPGKVNLPGKKALAFTTDGKLVLFFNPSLGLKIVDAGSGREQPSVQPRFSLKADEGSELNFASIAFAPGGRYLALCTGVTIHVVDLTSGAELFSCAGSTIAFTPDGLGVAIATNRNADAGSPENDPLSNACSVELVEINTGSRKRLLVATDRVSALAFSPDGRILAVSAGWRECSIRLYSTEDGHEIDAFACPSTRTHPEALAFAFVNMELAAGLDDTTAVVFNVRNGP